MYYLLLFHEKSDYTNAPQWYVRARYFVLLLAFTQDTVQPSCLPWLVFFAAFNFSSLRSTR